MSNAIKQAIAANKEIPHLNNHEIVLELDELTDALEALNDKVTDLQKKVSTLLGEKE